MFRAIRKELAIKQEKKIGRNGARLRGLDAQYRRLDEGVRFITRTVP